MAETSTTYDEVAYPGQVFPQTHPNRMATIAALHGIAPAPPERCRMLEVGCGDGENLIALALTAPESQFVGFDLARGGVEHGQAVIAELGLRNVRLEQADLMQFVAGAKFDYIVAHGFLSWVPRPVQHKLLELCREGLAPNGVAYISYNAFPGCHIRHMLRDMMRIHTAGISEPRQKIQQARAFAQFLRDGQTESDEYAAILRKEAEWVLNRDSDALLFHDDLADINFPFWFREFAALAAHHGMQFLSEADYYEMQVRAFPPATVEALTQLGENVLAREQYLDFLKCRRFRQSLIVHEGVAIKRIPSAEAVRELLVASAATPKSANVDLSPQQVEEFTGRGGAIMRIDHALTKAAMLALQSSWPRPLTFAELVSAANQRLGHESDENDIVTLAEVMLAAFGNGLVELHSYRSQWATEVHDRPIASPLVRRQLRAGRDIVSTLRPTNLLLEDPLDRLLLQLLDGSRDRRQIELDLDRYMATTELKSQLPSPLPKTTEIVSRSIELAKQNALLLA